MLTGDIEDIKEFFIRKFEDTENIHEIVGVCMVSLGSMLENDDENDDLTDGARNHIISRIKKCQTQKDIANVLDGCINAWCLASVVSMADMGKE